MSTPITQADAMKARHRFPHLNYMQIQAALERERDGPPEEKEKPPAPPLVCGECGSETPNDSLFPAWGGYTCETCEAAKKEKERIEWENRPLGKWPQRWPERAIRSLALFQGEPVDKAKNIEAILNGGGMVGLIGDRGRGKTLMATWIAQRRRERREEPGIYLRCADLFAVLRGSWGKDHPRGSKNTEEALMELFMNCELLVLDEVQERTCSDWENKILTRLLDHRYSNLLPTLVIGNLTAEELAANLGPSVTDRLKETGGIMECTWGSFRKPGGGTIATREPIPWSDNEWTAEPESYRGRGMTLNNDF